MRFSRGALAGLAALPLLVACGGGEAERGVWFVHATDPHLFEERKTDDELAGAAMAAGRSSEEGALENERRADEARMAAWEVESARAFRLLLETFDRLPDTDAEPSFLLLTGDLGFGERPIDGQVLSDRATAVAAALAERPGLTVYFVPGNNDVTDEAIASWPASTRFLTQVSEQLPAGVTLHDLTACYRPGAGVRDGCTVDIPGTRFRLIGFPTFSFKKPRTRPSETPPGQVDSVDGEPDTEGTTPTAPEAALAAADPTAPLDETGEQPAEGAPVDLTDRDTVHRQWLARLELLVSEARRERKRALIATHVPDLNDPFTQAGRELASAAPAVGGTNGATGGTPPATGGTTATGGVRAAIGGTTPETGGSTGGSIVPPLSPWSVPPALFERWREIVDRPTVARVLAGHFHDNHREIYRQPYAWERDPPGVALLRRPDRSKLWIAPPLGVRLQEKSPIQARGFALVGLVDGEAVRRLYWYDQARGVFEPEDASARRERAGERRGDGLDRALRALWDLGGEASALEKTAILMIALIAAFLTIVAVWKIPPPDTRLTQAAADQAPPTAEPPAGPFDNNFSRTVLGGLSGLVGIAFVDAFWKESPIDHKTYYVVCFLIFFLLVLLLSSLLRAFAEALRSRIVTEHRNRHPRRDHPPQGFWLYWSRRLWRWLLSLRATTLVFFDTFLNFVQGRNQLQTKVFGDEIFELQRSLVLTIDRTAEEVDRAIRRALVRPRTAAIEKERELPPGPVGDVDCRVNISVMSPDQQSLSYVSVRRGSLLSAFGPRSVAWVAATLGEARWWKRSYMDRAEEIVVAENSDGRRLPGWEPKVTLASVFAKRPASDYDAFLVLPVPYFRGAGRDARRGLIHVSLAREEHLDLLWEGLEAADGLPDYTRWRDLVRNRLPEDVGTAIRDEFDEPSTAAPWPLHPDLNAVLIQSLGILPEILRSFHPQLYEDLIKPR